MSPVLSTSQSRKRAEAILKDPKERRRLKKLLESINRSPVPLPAKKKNPSRKSMKDAIDDILGCAWQYDNKPHLLFSAVCRLALKFEDNPKSQDEIIRLMEYAYEHKGRPPRMR